mmetsp:Transcript_6087/g.14002  ORF Transcript_6087/g.14002 Transcript_6087/m.14002 type:complete len:205 (+) Transcript_6087:118-732(+)
MDEDKPSRFMKGGRRTYMWKRAMRMILDEGADDHEILLLLQHLKTSNEIRAMELSTGETVSRHGTLLHAAAVAGRVEISNQLIHLGADQDAINYQDLTPMDLALQYGQVAMTEYLEPMATKISDDLEPLYAYDERNLVWKQRKRRKEMARQIENAGISIDERREALSALDQRDREEWCHLEGTYLGKGFSLGMLEEYKARRSMI